MENKYINDMVTSIHYIKTYNKIWNKMKKVLKHLRSVSDKVTVELKAEQFSYKVMVFVEGGIIFSVEGKRRRKINFLID